MTFEEFLRKKKIDLIQFKRAEPVLFGEFQSHYKEMGEKSFDHSKKFLFNKLRRAYHLIEEPKPVVAREVIEINEVASQAEPLISPTVEATAYTPRFRPRGVAVPPPADSSEPGSEPSQVGTETSDPGLKPKPVFKPRFRAGVTNPAERTTPQPAEEIKAKPAYIPRFKPTTPSPVEKNTTENAIKETPAEPEQKAAAAYKPRFTAHVNVPKKTDQNDGSSSPPASEP